MNIYLKYDNMHRNIILYALICINSLVNISINYILSPLPTLSLFSSMNFPLSLQFSLTTFPLPRSSISYPPNTPIIFPLPVIILILLPSFHHSSSFLSLFFLKDRSNQGDLKFYTKPYKIISIKNLHQDTHIPLILCDRSSFQKSLTREFL